MKIKKLALLFLVLSGFFGVAQQQISKSHYQIINPAFEYTLNYEKALSHTQLDGLRYLNSRRRINIEGTQISIELYSAKELLDVYGKLISPLTIQNPIEGQDVKFALSKDNYKLRVISNSPLKKAHAQNFKNLFPKTIISTFDNVMLDDGGLTKNYTNNKSYVQTIYSDNGESPYLNFTSFSLENNFDFMYIYDGADASSKLIGEYTGGNSPQVVKGSGAYLTVVFISDGSVTQSGWSAIVGRGIPPIPPGTMSSPTCSGANPFCSGSVPTTFPATTGGTSGEMGPSYGCVLSQPNPAWYYLQIATAGNLILNISGTAGGDVDFVCWGPFTSPTAPCTAGLTGSCGSTQSTVTTNDACSGGIVDCSFSINATETCTIANATVGQYYMMMITNYSNQTQNIDLSQTGGSGSTNCNIVNCGVTASNTGPYCVGQTISLSAATTNTTATTYAWTGPNSFTSNQQNPTIPNSTTATAGVYSVTGTTGGTVTCVATTTVVVSANTPPIVNSPTICAGDTATLTALPATSNFVWSTGATTPSTTVNPAVTTVYSVISTVGTCTASNTATVTVNPLPIIVGPSITICAQQTGTLCASGGVSYTWTPGGMTGNCIFVSPAVSTNYTVVGTDTNGCTNIGGPISYCGVIVTPSPTISVTSNTLCVGASAPIVASGATSYTWSPSTTLSSTIIPNVTANPIVTTTYSVSGSNGGGCIAGATSTVTVYALPVFTVTALPACVGFPLTINITPGFANYSIPSIPYSSANSQIQIPNATAAMSGTYNIIVTDVNGCNNFGSAAVVVNPLPTVTSSATPVCVSSTGTLTAYGAETYTWNPTTYLNPTQGGEVYIMPTTTATINYTVTGTDVNGCTNTSDLTVQANNIPVVSIAPTTTAGCTPQCESYTVTSSPAPSANGAYGWSTSDGQTASTVMPNFCFTSAGNNTIKLTYTDINGCVNTATASVITYPIPVPDFDYSPKPVTILTPDVHFSNTTYASGGTTSYLWNFGDSLTLADTSNVNNPVYTYQNAASYNVSLIAISANGCRDTISKVIIVEEDFAIYVPNAFTPNGDGKNEIFKAEANGILDFTMYVFDRWGNNIFTTHDINVGWDGRLSNKGGSEVLQQDVYVWKIQLRNVNHQGQSYTGTVTLLK